MSTQEEHDGLRPKRGIAMNLTYTGVPTNEQDNGRDEKPWQRVAYELTKKGKHLYEPVKSVPSSFLIILLAWYFLLGYLTQRIEDAMPTPVLDAEVARDDTITFSEESARQYLRDILGSEPRVAGTAYHRNKTADVKSIVDGIALRANQHIHTDWQMATGAFLFETSAPHVNFYENASNVIAVLEGSSGFLSNGTVGSSVLVNCHYDSVPFAMGASDNAVFCAVMAEILNRFSRRTQKFKHNIVFLFNGAEENGLHASHGFLQHPWSKGIKTVVNLDAAGMNGKPSVFQVSDPGTLGVYSRAAPQPNAQGFGEFLFASGTIPSDTDFRIFRDFGGIHGIDIAFTKWGVVYHTRYDDASLVQRGVVQHAGDMLLPLLAELADLQDFEPVDEPKVAIYFDYLNLFLVHYNFVQAYIVDAFIVVLALASVGYYVWLVGPRISTIQELLWSVGGRLAATLAGVVLVMICTGLMVATTVQLRYLSEPWLVVPLYWMPYCIGAFLASQAFDAWRCKKSGLNRSIRTLQAMAASRLMLSIVAIIMMCIPSLSTARYVFTTPLCIMSLMSLISLTAVRYVRLKAGQHLVLETFLSAPASMFVIALSLRMDALFLPLTGRSASNDVIVAVINIALAILVASTLSGVELLFSRVRAWLPLALVGATCFVLMFIPFAPYRDDGPATMRHYWFHTEMVTYDQNKVPIESTTGVVVSKLDVNTISHTRRALQAAGIRVPAAHSAHCATRLYCGLPLYRTSAAKFLPEALILQTGGPAQFTPRPDLSYTRECLGSSCTYNFTVIGTAHNTITIRPLNNVTVEAWSLPVPLHVGLYLQGAPVYVLVHSVATYPVNRGFEFSLDCTVPVSLQSQPVLEVSHHAHKIYHPEDFTSEYSNLVNAMPKYFNIATFLSFRYDYVIV